MEYVTISPSSISSASPLKRHRSDIYFREGSRIQQVIQQERFSYGIFGRFGCINSAKTNCISLYYHQLEQNASSNPEWFVALFQRPLLKGAAHYSKLLKQHFAHMHRFDSESYEGSPHLIRSDRGNEFEFSLGGRIYGVEEYHPFNEDHNKVYDLVMLSFSVKYEGQPMFGPRKEQVFK